MSSIRGIRRQANNGRYAARLGARAAILAVSPHNTQPWSLPGWDEDRRNDAERMDEEQQHFASDTDYFVRSL
jgi:hypothetical protein